MKNFRMLMATATMVLSVGWMSTGFARIDTNMENPKFLGRVEPTLGLSTMELIEAIGKPLKVVARDCLVPYQYSPGKESISIAGDTWVYEFQSPIVRASLYVCILKGYAVGEQRNLTTTDGREVYNSNQEWIDLGLVQQAFEERLGDQSEEDRLRSLYTGPEYEI